MYMWFRLTENLLESDILIHEPTILPMIQIDSTWDRTTMQGTRLVICVCCHRYITAPNNNWVFMALAFDYKEQTIYWSDAGNKKIQGLRLDGSNAAFIAHQGTSGHVYGVWTILLFYSWGLSSVYIFINMWCNNNCESNANLLLPESDFCLWLSKFSANERRCHICNLAQT